MTKHEYLDPSGISDSAEICLTALSRLYHDHETGKHAAESLVVSCASAVEAYFDTVLTALILRNRPGDNRLFTALLGEVREDIFRTWDSRLTWLRQGFGISIAGDSATQNFRYVVELRNSLVHGGGMLTDYQVRDFARACQLKRQMSLHLGVHFKGRLILLMPGMGKKAVDLSRKIVCHLDEARGKA